MTRSARLVLVGTPIGNLGDASPRTAEALGDADVVCCEDTRRSGRLLAHLGIRAPELLRLDDHTEVEQIDRLVERIRGGAVVAVVSDAGMPGLSDPGARLAAQVAAQDLLVEVVPGPFAGAVAVTGSGLLDPSGRFCFEGFLPRKGAARTQRLSELVGERRTVVLYEAPHRLARTLADLAATLGADRRVALCRELTKLHEEYWRGTLAEAVAHCDSVAPRGEFVVVLDGAPEPVPLGDDELRAELAVELAAGATRRDAASTVATRHGLAPNRLKRLLVEG
ncbi:MAG: 16S rRNA (cytidine(1402)-2'-O)-methyltransferase [Actinomycetota bacterium]|nr:16S rRNA (cytidine(1402)-2'-O)-methyltransferase [Actinomycetota bacterium]